MKQFKRMIALVVSAILIVSITAASVPTVSAAIYNSSSPIPSFSSIEVIDGGVHFKWKPYQNANCPDGVFYRVYYLNANGDWARLTTTAATQYVDADVHIGTSFRYTIRCVTPDGREFASGFNSKGWIVTYYDTPTVTSVISKTNETAVTGSADPTEAADTDAFSVTQEQTATEEPTEEAAKAPTEAPATESVDEAAPDEEEAAAENTVIEEDENTEIAHSEDELAPTGSTVNTDTITWSGQGSAFRVYRKYLDPSIETEVVSQSTDKKTLTVNNTKQDTVYAYQICALDKYGAVASERVSTPYYINGELYCTRNRWIYELLSAKHSEVADADFSDWSYEALSDAAHEYGALTPAGYFDDGVSLTRQFAANTLVNLFGFQPHTLGNAYNVMPISEYPYNKLSSAVYYATDSANGNMNTAAYYGWITPDRYHRLYPQRDVSADEWDEMMDELSLYRAWNGKTVIAFGDSGMQGKGNIVYKNSGGCGNSWRDSNRKDFANKRFPRYNRELMEGPVEFIGEKYGMIHRDYSWAGASMGTELTKNGKTYEFTDDASYKSHIANQIRTAVREKQTADLILMNGGDNDEYFPAIPYSSVSGKRIVYDWGYSEPDWFSVAAHREYHKQHPEYFHYKDGKVSVEYTNETSFVDGVKTTFELVKEYYPDAPVIYVRSHQINYGNLLRQRIYQEKILSLADSYRIATVDLFNSSVLDGFNKLQAEKYCYDIKNGKSNNAGIHPNALGYSIGYLPYIEKKLLELS